VARGAGHGLHERVFAAVFLGLVALGWVTLASWSASPWGRYLDHGDWTDLGIAGSICRAFPAGATLLPALLFVGGWLLMTAAMMLPTTLPFVLLFRRLVARRPHPELLMLLLVAGYLAVWLAFGLAAHLLSIGLLALVRRSDWLTFNGWAIGALVLATAGLFQLSPLKQRCLAVCHAPMPFIAARWQGRAPLLESLRLGAAHGLFCVGCCWALMLLMFVVGTGSVGWMLVLGALMAAEKNLPIARRMTVPLAVALMAAATWTAISGARGLL
jgi:predicted metal-binding membrane protein